ncbi:MAG: glycosyltransferase [Candidatus Omnitrophota bacterium]|nr:glycosyltransferase [Candidatus Omnitrophota bacterium]
MIKVLMFNKLYHPYLGGVERAVYDLCETIKKDVELTVLASNAKPKTEITYKDNYRIVRAASLCRIFSSVYLGISVPLWWCRLKSDIIHFHFPSPIAELYCLMLCPRGKPLVVTYHADIIGYSKPLFFYRPFLIEFLKRANRIVVSSPTIVEQSPFLSKFKNKCITIPYGIETEKFRLTQEGKNKSEEIRRRFKKPIVLFVGRLVKYKGLNYLIDAMKKIDAVLLIVGNGPEETGLKIIVNELGVNKEKVFFLGVVSDKELPFYYHASDVFVLPSITGQEAFGIVQLEAQACAKPVVSTALPTGVPFANLDGVTGIIVPPRSSEKLAEAINKLLKDDKLREQLGLQAKKRVESQFTRQVMAQKTLDLYRGLL